MVFFTCNACGESMKKNQVEKHFKFQCKRCEYLSCVDCSQEFWGEDYAKHTKCISEDAKYGGKDYKPKPNANKGERKQEEWTEQVQSAINKCKSNPKLKNLLERLKDYSNIPRKKPKFENFVKNSLRIPGGLATQMWDAISVEIHITKTNNQANGTSNNSDSDNKDVSNTSASNGVTETTNDQEAGSDDKKKLSKRERKEERKKNKNKVEKKDKKNTPVDKVGGEGDGEVKTKKKKRKHEEMEENESKVQNEEDINTESKKKQKKKKNKSEDSEPAAKKSKKEEPVENEVACDSNDVSFEKKTKFNWEAIIVGLLKKAENNQLSIKKLRKKVLAEYTACHAESAHMEEKLLSKFNKKINNTTRFKVHKEKVTLKS